LFIGRTGGFGGNSDDSEGAEAINAAYNALNFFNAGSGGKLSIFTPPSSILCSFSISIKEMADLHILKPVNQALMVEFVSFLKFLKMCN
jgi:hypothetical protein